MLESTHVEEPVVEWALSELGVRSIKLNLGGNTGWPDRLFFIPGGRPLLIEFKRPGSDLEPRQRLIRAFLKYNDYDYTSCDNQDSAKTAIKHAVDAAIEKGWRPNSKRATKELEAARLSKEGRKVPPGARSSSFVLGPRVRQDKHHIRSPEGLKKR